MRGATKSIVYRLCHAFSTGQYVIVPKSQHAKAGCLEICCSLGVVLRLPRVLTTVNLDYKSLFQAYKINYIGSYRVLPPKL